MPRLFSANAPPKTLAVIGGGLAGIAAAESAIQYGWNVHLHEWSRVLGGRAASRYDSKSKRWIDNGQHLLLGCCSELLALNQRLGLTDLFARSDSVSFASANGKKWDLNATPFLPRHWQLTPAFLKNPFLSFRDRLATGLLLRKLSSLLIRAENRKYTQVFAQKRLSLKNWLDQEQASESAIRQFWEPLIFSALSESLDKVCLFAAAKVVRDGFMSGRDAMSIHVPKCPLRDIYHHLTLDKLERLGVQFHFCSKIIRLNTESDQVHSLIQEKGEELKYDGYILAIPPFRAWKLLEESDMADYAADLQLERFELGAITSVHLWFDRPLLPDRQCQIALLDGVGQWLFRPLHGKHMLIPTLSPNQHEPVQGHYHQVVISASHRLLSDGELTAKGYRELTARVLQQLRNIFPDRFSGSEGAQLLHSKVSTAFDAVFSPTPEIFRFRPAQQTPLSNLALAGDWTQTDWPATMEGAVRSGRAAVTCLDQ